MKIKRYGTDPLSSAIGDGLVARSRVGRSCQMAASHRVVRTDDFVGGTSAQSGLASSVEGRADGCWFHPGLELSHEANNYTYDDRAKMEGAGAVFLPNAGFSTGVDGKQYYSSQGGYWTTSPAYEITATYLFIKNHVAILKGDLPRWTGLAVRLVRTAPYAE